MEETMGLLKRTPEPRIVDEHQHGIAYTGCRPDERPSSDKVCDVSIVPGRTQEYYFESCGLKNIEPL